VGWSGLSRRGVREGTCARLKFVLSDDHGFKTRPDEPVIREPRVSGIHNSRRRFSL
jgi:hypothetical protein